MTVGVRLNIKGDDTFVQYLRDFPKVAKEAGALAINDTLRRGHTKVRRELQSQVNFPDGYLNKSRLSITWAKEGNLTGAIIGRRRPTSLARFDAQQLYQPNSTRPGRKPAGVTVRVKQRRAKLPRAFIKKLNNGNRGLAIRLPHGERPKRRFNAKPLYKDRSTNLWLLYGPSVDQVMRSERGGESVITRVAPDLEAYMNREFRRQFGRLYRG